MNRLLPKQTPGTTIDDPMMALVSTQRFSRVTVRVDGPKTAVAFAPAVLR